MWVRPSGTDENGLDLGFEGEIVGEGGFHAFAREVGKGEVVGGGCGEDEGVNFRKGMRGDYVDGFEVGGEMRVGGEGGEVEDEEDETVFATVVGEGEGGDSG